MSASSSKRLGRLVARIAEERAIRGRPQVLSRPKGAVSRVFGIGGPPEGVSGTPANIMSTYISPPITNNLRHKNKPIYDAEGRRIATVGETYGMTIKVVKGVDYDNIVQTGTDSSNGGTFRTGTGEKSETKLDDDEKSLLDRVFEVEGFNPGSGFE